MSKKDPKKVYLENGVEVLNNYELNNYLRDREDLKSYDLLIALCLATRRNSVHACCWPSKETLVRDSGVTKPRVNKSLKSLQANGIIIIINHGWYIGKDKEGNKKELHNGKDGNIYYFCYDLEYQEGLLEDEMHPTNKVEKHLDDFEQALMILKG